MYIQRCGDTKCNSAIAAKGNVKVKIVPTPVARAIALALTLAVGGSVNAARAADPRPFSSAWFSVKSSSQAATAQSIRSGNTSLGMPPPLAQQQQANQQLQRAITNLGKTASAIAAQQAAQAAARRAAATTGQVPDGMAPGGLSIDANPATKGWSNASDPIQSVSNGRTVVSINQTKDRAVLNWNTFNIGYNTTISFDQATYDASGKRTARADWAVLNRVNDPDARPSQIQGQIKGDGTVMLVNRNGVIFSGTSQVNVRNLVAAAADMADSQFNKNGLYNGANAVFTQASGTITLQPGAQITTHEPTSVTQGGGYVLLVGNEVHNAGEITTRTGQTMLAAGDSFFIRKGVGTDVNSASTTRGNEISPQFTANSTAGLVDNTGMILAREGDITLAGRSVQQNGVAAATTSVSQRGTVHLLNSINDVRGKVTLGPQASTVVLLEDDPTSTALDSQRDALINESAAQDLLRAAGGSGVFDNLSLLTDRRDLSRVEIVSGGDIVFAGDSLTLATDGQIVASAGHRSFVADQAQLDVSGAVGVNVSMASNNVKVNIQGNELRDSPPNRDSGNLLNSNVWIDRRQLSLIKADYNEKTNPEGYKSDRWYAAGGLLEVSGYLSNQGHNIGEWSAQGGTVTLTGKEVVTQAGSTVNLAGGSLNVQTGYVYKTWLKGSDGRLYALDTAPSNMLFDGVYQGFEATHGRWGKKTTEYYYNPLIAPQKLLENGYTVGRDAGTLIINAPTAVLEGDIDTSVYDGPRQTQVRAALADGYQQSQTAAARAGALVIAQYGGLGRSGAYASDIKIGNYADVTTAMSADGELDLGRANTVWLDAMRLNAEHFGGLSIATLDTITIDAALSLANGGNAEFIAPVIDVKADIRARGGSVTAGNFLTVDGAGTVNISLFDAKGAAHIGVSAGATIDTRGLWTNLLTDPDADPSRLAFIDGGAVSLTLTGGNTTQTTNSGDVTLEAGSRIDASAGGVILANGKFTGGKGGDIGLATFDWTDTSHQSSRVAATLTLDGTLASYGFSQGGALTLRTGGTVTIGQQTVDLSSGQLPAGVAAPYDLTLRQDYLVAAGTPLPVQMTRYFAPGMSLLDQPMPATSASALVMQWSSIFSYSGNATVGTWTDIPVAMTYRTGDNRVVSVPRGGTIPAGVNLVSIDTAGLTAMPIVRFPSSVFAQLSNQFNNFTIAYESGSVYTVDVAVSAGTVISAGTLLSQTAAVQRPVQLEPGLFSSGFSRYVVNGGHGVFVSDGTHVDVTMPVYQLSASSYRLGTDADITRSADLVLPPPYTEDPIKAVLTQRAGASLVLAGSEIGVGHGASLTVDPEQSIRLISSNRIVVEGDLVAHGGAISLLPDLTAASSAFEDGVLWIGEQALLDVSGETATAIDNHGRRYGFAQDGGLLLIGLESNASNADAAGQWSTLNAITTPVVIRPGARLLANGAAATIDTAQDDGLRSAATPVVLAGKGGLIRIGSAKSIFNDGALEARSGGAGAAGGTLNLVLEFGTVLNQYGQPILDPVGRTITLTQNDVASGLAADLTPANSAGLPSGQARISADRVAAGGFGTLDLWSRNRFAFKGDVALNLPQALLLHRGALSPTDATAAPNVALSAPYVLLDGAAAIKNLTSDVDPEGTNRNWGSLTISAALIDIQNKVAFGGYLQTSGATYADVPGFAHVTLNSTGDVRFGGSKTLLDASSDPTNPSNYLTLAAGLYSNAADFTINASQLYPVTGGVGVVQIGSNHNPTAVDPNWTLIINGLGDDPAVPLSAFGSLTLNAPTIHQNGIVRAPLGTVAFGMKNASYYDEVDHVSKQYVSHVTLGAGSVSSVSAKGLTMPYGGTVDGLSWLYNARAAYFADPAVFNDGVTFSSATLTAEPGAWIDVAGGGSLTGAGFITGRGGSVDVLHNALANANPANAYSTANAQVYALVPGSGLDYAPVTTDAAMPAIGWQIVLDHGVGDLASGIYTLMPATYALLPGAYRIEIGAKTPLTQDAVRLTNGSYVATGILGTANTGLRDSLATQVIITPSASVRGYSQYNETSYSQFAIANAITFGAVTPRLERDASSISIDFGPNTGDVLDFRGSADLTADEGGLAGTLFVATSSRLNLPTSIEVRAAGSAVTDGMASVTAEDLSRFNAGTLAIGGSYGLQNVSNPQAVGPTAFGPQVVMNAASDTTVLRADAQLQAGQVFLMARNAVTVERGATIDTRRGASNLLDSSLGYVFSSLPPQNNQGSSAILAVGNGRLDFLGATSGSSPSSVAIADDVSLLTRGTVALSSGGAQTLGDVNLEARYLALATTAFNIGSAQSLAAGSSMGGINLTQQIIDRLLGSTTPFEQLTLAASQSINFYGNARLDLTGQAGVAPTLVLATPALYGWGDVSDQALIAADTVVWSGVPGSGVGVPGSPFVNATPGAVTAGGAGTGASRLNVDARRIVFGYAPGVRSQDQTALDHLALGFSAVNLVAGERITANNRNTLSVYASGANPGAGFDAKTYVGSGGTLNLVTPLLTGEAGSSMTYRIGGDLTVSAPAAGAAPTSSVTALGADIQLFGNQVNVDTAVVLPSGRLSITAGNGIVLERRAAIDLAGRAVRFFDVTQYSWGGDLLLETTHGAIAQAAASSIDVSATKGEAGSITATATGFGGTVDLAGSLAGAGGQGLASGGIDLRADSLADFAGFNQKLNASGFFEARSFAIKTGDLTIGDEVRAKTVAISADGGSLTVNGRIDASGTNVGSISLAARDDLTLAPGAVLDVHGTTLAVDGRGAPIEANNRGHIELTTRDGTLRLRSGATLDLSTPGRGFGQVVLNAPRTSETSGDVKIDAAGRPAIKGAASIALNAFWTYVLPGGVIDQTMLEGYDAANTRFITSAMGDGALQNRIAGLAAYGDVFHLRPGVEIASTGDLATSGDLDLSGYRYGTHADRDANSADYGAGEPMALVIRAAGTLTVKGSISDGFAGTPGVPGTPNTYDGVVDIPAVFESDGAGGYYDFDYSTQYYMATDWIVPNTASYEYGLYLGSESYNPGDTVKAGTKFYLGDLYLDGGITLPVIAASFTAGIPDIPAQSGASAGATVQAAGTESASLRLVAGADLASADRLTLAAASALRSIGAGYGSLVLAAPITTDAATSHEVASVIRTGTGSLDLRTGGDFRQTSLYGIYTAGTQVGDTDTYNKTASDSQRMYFTERGGDVGLSAQGDLRSYGIEYSDGGTNSSEPSNWLWRQGNSATGEATAWGIYFGGFTGIGTLGGGNVRITARGDAGSTSNWNVNNNGAPGTHADDSFNLVVASSGYVADGTLSQFGGGTLQLAVGGRLNTGVYSSGGIVDNLGLGSGAVTNLRGDTTIEAGSVGQLLASGYGLRNSGAPLAPYDPRAADTTQPRDRTFYTPLRLVSGDGVIDLHSRGTAAVLTATDLSPNGLSLQTGRSGTTLFSAGGSLSQLPAADAGLSNSDNLRFDPANFMAIAPSGSITLALMLSPSSTGSLELLAGDSLFGKAIMTSGTMATDLHAGDPDPIRLYAVAGDVTLTVGDYQNNPSTGSATQLLAAKPVVMRAGRDILSNAYILNNDPTDVSVISAGRDILNSVIGVWGPGLLEVTAGRNIYQSDEGDRYLNDRGSIISYGAIVPGDSRLGASIVVTAGAGAAGPDYVLFARQYLDPANQVVAGVPLADQPGKVARTYQDELIAWLKDRFGYTARDAGDALAYFGALAPEQQDILLRQVYWAELKASGREFNDPASSRYGSYLRGRTAIAALFPVDRIYGGDITLLTSAALLGPNVRPGGGIRTLFGGDIQMLTPGGKQIIGVDGQVPPSSSGLVTQGAGDISLYARDSILLGLSRIMTTFGGNILGWSATGDINAGRGAKTTQVYTPPKRVYDDDGNVTLSPDAPSTGAGIATLAPIPEVSAGDIDLIAPLGTVDAGEAGIRVSGNVNIAALHVVNAENIQVRGESMGIPSVAAVNVGALTSASQAAGSAVQAAEQISRQSQQNRPSVISVEILGYGNEGLETDGRKTESGALSTVGLPSGATPYNTLSPVQIAGLGESIDPQQWARMTLDEQNFLQKNH